MSGSSDRRDATRNDAQLVCRSFTTARRFPLVLGSIGGFRVGPLTLTQVGVLTVGLLVMVATRGIWARFAWPANLALGAGLPWAAAWAVRHATVEGRAPLKALAGWLTVVGSPTSGRLRGRPGPRPRAVRLSGRVLVARSKAAASHCPWARLAGEEAG